MKGTQANKKHEEQVAPEVREAGDLENLLGVNKRVFFTRNIHKNAEEAAETKEHHKSKNEGERKHRSGVRGDGRRIELMTLLFLNSLAEEAKAKAFEEKSATIRVHHVRAVSKKVLKKARG
ncbi:hypothetical protein GOODEAATRI_022900 [Goodea atripinnis]|uniref:Centromere protein W n=1 Tax=Goodea atripinnis TaxID=208336 RepID=A0ABV0NCV5_9TELE